MTSYTGHYWQSTLKAFCESEGLGDPSYEIFEHSGGTTTADGGSSSVLVYSCVVTVNEREFATSYVYKAEENAKERAAKKAFETLSNRST